MLAAVLIFFARVLFTHNYIIPWDFREFHLPIATALFDAMKGTGSFLWDTSTYCGRPLFADPQGQVFYPPTEVAVLVSTWFGYSSLAQVLEWELVLHIFAAGAFTYLMLRMMGISRAAALCGGLVFELGGFFASQTQHFDTVEGAVWMPLMWVAAWKLRLGFSGRWFCALGIAGALSILAGVPAMSSTAIGSTIAYAGILWVFRETRVRGVATVLAAVVLAVGLSAIMLVPAIELTLRSVAKYRTDWFDGWGWPPRILISLIWPPGRDTVCDLIYCGVGGLVLAVSAVFNKYARKSSVPLFCLTVLSVFWMFGNGTIFGRAVWAVIPNLVKGSLYPYYGMAPVCLGIAVLSGIGLDRIQRLTAAHKYAIAVLVAADLIVVGSGRPMNADDVRKVPGITRDQIGGSSATLQRLQELIKGNPPARIDTHGMPVSFSTTAALIEVPTANGYNPLVLERLIQSRLAFAKGYRWGAWYEVENLASPMIDALNIRYILANNAIPAVVNGTPRYSLAAELPGFLVYENRSALPRFWLVHEVRVAHTPQEAFEQVQRPDFMPSRFAVVEDDAGPPAARPPALPVVGREEGVRVVHYEPRAITLEVRAGAPGFLATSEVHYPGWRGFVDGAEVPVLMTNGAFRGLPIAAGEHVVQFRFAPRIVYLGAGISALSLVIGLLILGR
ncbi:MAG TPA: hypothetical protein VGZ73_01215 [Bryobacteraceae bacterium]|nr:hypothetical protein [Bryobacteraceae bacterium]